VSAKHGNTDRHALITGVSGLVTTRARSELMSRVRSRGNESTEKSLAKLLRSQGISGWRRHVPLPGTPDFAFQKYRIAVFVDGCFWHGCPACYSKPKTNAAFWKSKIASNQERDRKVCLLLRKSGWKVLRLWECQIKRRPEIALTRVIRTIAKYSG